MADPSYAPFLPRCYLAERGHSALKGVVIRAGKNLGSYKKIRFFTVLFTDFKGFLGFKCRTQNYDPQAKIRPCERYKLQFIFEYYLY